MTLRGARGRPGRALVVRLGAAAGALAVSLAACQSPVLYFAPPDSVAVSYPSTAGTPAYLGMFTLRARGSDAVTIERVSFDNPAGFVEMVVLVETEAQISKAGFVGIMAESDLVTAGIPSGALAPAAGYMFGPADGRVGVVARVLAAPGTVAHFDSVVLTFRVNGGPSQAQSFPFQALACPGAVVAQGEAACAD